MDIEELITALISEEPPDSVYDDLRGGWNRLAELNESGTAKIDELTAMLAAATEEIASLKARNYDLMMAIPANDEPEETTDDPSEDGEPQSYDDLFEEKE